MVTAPAVIPRLDPDVVKVVLPVGLPLVFLIVSSPESVSGVVVIVYVRPANHEPAPGRGGHGDWAAGVGHVAAHGDVVRPAGNCAAEAARVQGRHGDVPANRDGGRSGIAVEEDRVRGPWHRTAEASPGRGRPVVRIVPVPTSLDPIPVARARRGNAHLHVGVGTEHREDDLPGAADRPAREGDRKSTRLNSSHLVISY